jgi:hypothetical protein
MLGPRYTSPAHSRSHLDGSVPAAAQPPPSRSMYLGPFPSRHRVQVPGLERRAPRVGRIRPTSRGVAGHLQRGHGPHPPERRPVPVAVDGRRALRDGCCAACVRPVGPTTGGRRRPASSHRAGRGAGSLPECEARSARGGSPPSSRKLGTTRSSVPSQGTGHSVRVPGPLGESSVWPSVAFRVGSTALCL